MARKLTGEIAAMLCIELQGYFPQSQEIFNVDKVWALKNLMVCKSYTKVGTRLNQQMDMNYNIILYSLGSGTKTSFGRKHYLLTTPITILYVRGHLSGSMSATVLLCKGVCLCLGWCRLEFAIDGTPFCHIEGHLHNWFITHSAKMC